MNFAKIEVYMRPTCKDCQEMVKFLKAANISHSLIDITSSEGYLASKDMELSVLPTVIMKDQEGKVVESAFCVEAVKRILGDS